MYKSIVRAVTVKGYCPGSNRKSRIQPVLSHTFGAAFPVIHIKNMKTKKAQKPKTNASIYQASPENSLISRQW
ncbi:MULTISPECIES: hypothetical protein [unclassified Methanosarcina]|uniref:hypothetical protein n=1 Tax=unclassified Methanosarcina TaxID=2644672 RepID=UPI000A80653E|nr:MULTISPECIES: hypothetical protein [unclassified Methanosarcina]